MKIRVKVCDSIVKLERFLNGINVDSDLVQITESGYAIGNTAHSTYTVIYKSRW